VIHVIFQQVSHWAFVSHASLWLVIFQAADQAERRLQLACES